MKLKTGDIIYSEYFKRNIMVVTINSDTDWTFVFVEGPVLKAQTPLSFFEEKLEWDRVK